MFKLINAVPVHPINEDAGQTESDYDDDIVI